MHGDDDGATGADRAAAIGRAGPRRVRLTAALLDNVLLPFLVAGTLSLFLAGLVGALASAVVALLLTVGPEASSGRTPGKAMLDLRTTRDDGAPIDLRLALARRPWPVLAGAGLAVPVLRLPTALLLVLIAVSVARTSDGRALHDRWVGTRVGRDPATSYERQLGLLVFVVLLVGTLVRLTFPELGPGPS